MHFFVAIAALSLFIVCLLEGDNKRKRESNGNKKMYGVPFHGFRRKCGVKPICIPTRKL